MKPVILFDMDGVLINVADSYREAIKRTVEFFTGDYLLNEDINEYKFRGGLNNDWDLSLAIIRDRGAEGDRNAVIDCFQNYYLGSGSPGLIDKEEPFINSEFLKRLIDKGYQCGIVTGRPGKEARYVLDRYRMRRFFKVLIAMDDLPEDRGKPEPDGINIALESFESKKAFYLGDSVDDMYAAVSAGILPIGVVWSYRDKEAASDKLETAGAETILSEPEDIWRVLK